MDSAVLSLRHLIAILAVVCLSFHLAIGDELDISSSTEGDKKQTQGGSLTSDHLPSMRATVGKRSTLLLDRLVLALQKALKQEVAVTDELDLQRRGPGGKLYWRCYFNAVTCFRRK